MGQTAFQHDATSGGCVGYLQVLPEEGAGVPANKPGDITILLNSLRGLHIGSTSLETIVDVRALPARVSYSAGTSSHL